MPTAFLTGATGFLGAHVARALLARGWRVRALARGGAGRLRDLAQGVEAIEGDLSERTDLAAAAAGADAVVHVAGVIKARTLEEYREVNVRGTQRLAEAAGRSAPGALFLLVSSQAAAGPAPEGPDGRRGVTESDPARPVSWYGISKKEGEDAVRALWKGPWIVARPSVVFGPGDRGLLVLFRAAARGWLPVPNGSARVQVIRAERAAEAIARAADRRDLAGRTGFLADPQPLSILELSRAIARLPPKPARLVPVPPALVRAAGALETVVEAVTRKSQPFNADKAREILAGDWVCDPGPFSRDLQLPAPEPLAEALSSTWDWYVRHGWLTL
jgi:nucleoside-diphosphate-sugar epimerase